MVTRFYRVGVFMLFLCISTARVFAALSVELVSPGNKGVYPACSTITLRVNVTTDGEAIRDLIYYHHAGTSIRRVTAAPWEFVWSNVKPGNYPVYAKVRGENGSEAISDTAFIAVGDVDRNDIIVNGGFDCDFDNIAPWTAYRTGTADYAANIYTDFYFDDSTYLAVEIEDGGEVDWYIQLIQRTGLLAGHTYQIYFYADAEDPKNIYVNWQESVDDHTVHWQSGNILIEEADLYGPYEFVCEVDDPSAEFKFILGANAIDIFLDAVSIIDLNAVDVEDKPAQPVAGFELYPAFPNPFNLQTMMRYRLPEMSRVALDVYNMHGRKVKTLVTESQPAGLYSVKWDGATDDGNGVASGVYVYRLHAETAMTRFEQSGKLVLLK